MTQHIDDHGTLLCNAMKAVGLPLPDECVNVTIHFPCDGVVQLVYTCHVTGEALHAIGKALQHMAVAERLKT